MLNNNDLPLPGIERSGWPWDSSIECPSYSDFAADEWPQITIVTPSFNQGKYLEETIRSVLLQGYPNLEYYIIDGGSTDNSVEIIRKYAPWITYWVSEVDEGQSDAIIKGFSRASGDIINWLNSDDIYLPGALHAIAKAYHEHPNTIIAAAVENAMDGMSTGEVVQQSGINLPNLVKYWEKRYRWHQPGLFFPRVAYERTGGLDRTLLYNMDHDLICRLLQEKVPVTYLKQKVVRFRFHGESKTCSLAEPMLAELGLVSRRYWDAVSTKDEQEGFPCRELIGTALSHVQDGRIDHAWQEFSRALKMNTPLALYFTMVVVYRYFYIKMFWGNK